MKQMMSMAALLAVIFTFVHFTNSSGLDRIRTDWVKNADQLIVEMESLNESAHEPDLNPELLKSAISSARKLYKECEHLYAYYYASYVKQKINSAPLPQLDPYFPYAVIVQPQGLQRLDELIFITEQWDSSAVAELRFLTAKWIKDFEVIQRGLPTKRLEHREIFESLRLQYIRIFTLGLTGFDTPGSLNALAEAQHSFRGMDVHLHYLGADLSGNFEALSQLHQKAQVQLDESNDFDAFDRLQFLKEVINPAYRLSLNYHLQSKVETIEEVLGIPKAWNYKSDNLFARDFLNVYYYANLPEQEHTEALTQLGEKLFYDTRLSGSGKLSCASCHKPELAFTDGLPKSLSNNGMDSVQRNAPTLLNAVYSKRFFWDMRARRFDDQMEHVVQNHKEFNTSYLAIFKKLQADTTYAEQFAACFPKMQEPINQSNFNRALNAYLIGLTSFDSPVDAYIRGEQKKLNAEIKAGFNLFMGKAACGTCHFAPTFAGLVPPDFQESESEVLGVLRVPNRPEFGLDGDPGRAENGIPKEVGVYFYQKSFKTPTVRNVELTSPYFHNGRYNSLEEVVDFYDHGGGAGAGLALEHQTLPADSLQLSEREKHQLIAFMRALTDTKTVKRFSQAREKLDPAY